jgi:hypothetical protein
VAVVATAEADVLGVAIRAFLGHRTFEFHAGIRPDPAVTGRSAKRLVYRSSSAIITFSCHRKIQPCQGSRLFGSSS